MIYGESKVSICEIMRFVRMFRKEEHPRGLVAKISISRQIVSETPYKSF